MKEVPTIWKNLVGDEKEVIDYSEMMITLDKMKNHSKKDNDKPPDPPEKREYINFFSKQFQQLKKQQLVLRQTHPKCLKTFLRR